MAIHWFKWLFMGNRVSYKRRRIKLPFNPRSGTCDCCGRSRPRIKHTSIHHWRYAYKWKEIKDCPRRVLDYTSELCYACHEVANAIRRVNLSDKKVKKLLKLRKKALSCTKRSAPPTKPKGGKRMPHKQRRRTH